MKILKKVPIIFTFVLMIFVMACGKNDTAASNKADGITGSWAYIHDKEKAIAVFREDGTAQYEGKEYSYEYDSQFIKLKDTNGDITQVRYVLDKDGMYLYSNNIYTYSSAGEPKGLVGEWLCAEKNWSYEFTDKGTFIEDGYFPGYYTVDDNNSTFKLVYNDMFEDTVCYYKVEGDKLYVEYPWRMVKMGTKK